MEKQLSLIREESERHDLEAPTSSLLPKESKKFVWPRIQCRNHAEVNPVEDDITVVDETDTTDLPFNQSDIIEELARQSSVLDRLIPASPPSSADAVKTDSTTGMVPTCTRSSRQQQRTAISEGNSPLIERAQLNSQQQEFPSSEAFTPGDHQHQQGAPRRKRTRSVNWPTTTASCSLKRLSMPLLTGSGHFRKDSTASSASSNTSNRQHQEIFNRLEKLEGDRPRPGMISKAILKKLISTSAKDLNDFKFRDAQIPVENLRRLISEFDANNDGYIDEDEFNKILPDNDEEQGAEVERLLAALTRTAFAEVYRLCPPPVFLLTLSLLQLVIFTVQAVHLHDAHHLPITWHDPAPVCSALIFNPYRRREVWRFISYSLVHSGIAHVALNLGIQLFVGLPLEMSHGSARIAVVYTAGVLSGAMATSSFNPKMYLAGASAGVYSLIAAHLASLILNWKEDVMIIRQRIRQGRVNLAHSSEVYRHMRLLSVLVYTACDISYAVYTHMENLQSNIGYLAHLAGGGAGILVGICVLKNRRKETWEIGLKVVCSLFCLTLIVLSVVWNVRGNEIYRRYNPQANSYFLPPDLRDITNCSYFGP